MPPLDQAPKALDFIYSEANGWRSREKGVIGEPLAPATAVPYLPGTFLWRDLTGPPPTPGAPPVNPNFGKYYPVTLAAHMNQISAILMYPTDTRDGDVEAAIFVRDGEVNDGYLIYAYAIQGGAEFAQADIDTANAQMGLNDVIVRQGVLSSSVVTPPIAPTP
jgi:Bacteriophage lambda head decoration protein D